jgi:hypothetical protein
MGAMTGLVTHPAVLAAAADPRPDDNNVVAGWLGFAVMILLVVAVVFILRSFTKQLKKVDRAKEAGLFDDSPDSDSADSGSSSDTSPTQHEV